MGAWFGPDAIAELVPDPDTRGALCADIPGVPLSYLAETAPREPGSQRVSTCYLRLSDAYLDAQAVAIGAGWPTMTCRTLITSAATPSRDGW